MPSVAFGQGITRRAFLGGAAVVGAGAVNVGCAPISQMLYGMVPEDQFVRNHGATAPRPVDPKDYNEANAQHVVFVEEQKDRERGLAKLRIEFNRTSNLNLFNPFLKYRHKLTAQARTSPEAKTRLEAHDALIREFVTHPKVEFWFRDKDGRLEPMDYSTRWLIGARIVDFMHARPDLLRRNLQQDPPLRFVMHELLLQTQPNIKTLVGQKKQGGFWSMGNADVHINKREFWYGALITNDGHAVDIHEYVHGLDSAPGLFGMNWLGHLFHQLPKTQRDVVEAERLRLGGKYQKQAEAFQQRIQKEWAEANAFQAEQQKHKATPSALPVPTVATHEVHPSSPQEFPDVLSQLRPLALPEPAITASEMFSYAFTAPWEFKAVAAEFFYELPEVLTRESVPIYQAYQRLFGWDSRDYAFPMLAFMERQR